MLRYKEIREEAGYTLRDIEKYIGINRSSMSQIENGKIDAKASQLFEFSKHFNVSPDYVLGNTNIRNEKAF
jgi:transcriptional regulator with XRE-family HTH domain